MTNASRNVKFDDFKLGAVLKNNGCSFSVFSRNAKNVSLILFETESNNEPIGIYRLSRDRNKTGDIWHIFVEGVKEGWAFVWKMGGDYLPSKGHLFNENAILLDPYSKAVSGIINSYPEEKNEKSQKYISEYENTVKGVVCSDNFDWEGDKPLNRKLSEMIIYEMNVRGFTADNNSRVEFPGTYNGIIEKIPYLKKLGITAIELLPVNEFGAYKDNRLSPSGKILNNYWGYNTLSYFAPEKRYSSNKKPCGQIIEFKEMVKSLHKAGIEVILDIVFNHTVEGGKYDKILNFKGIDNPIYYILDKNGNYLDFTGCGNTFNCNHPIVSDFIIDCLVYWVQYMHIDGFRFDLASALNRDENGNLSDYSPLIKRIEQTAILRDTKIIAEPWDAAGGYQVGGFRGRWAEWNGKYRDTVRKFWRGDTGILGDFARVISGSEDLFGNRAPQQSINFIFSHDGFTLWDWLSYGEKHNFENGHNNEDGENNNYNFNNGIEGETKDGNINKLRKKQAKNLIATLFLSLGTPMLNAGDEFLRTQKGNNNPYCQDNEINWFDWSLIEKNDENFKFFKKMIDIRKSFLSIFNGGFYKNNKDKSSGDTIVEWFGKDGKEINWNMKSSILGMYIKKRSLKILILFNGGEIDELITLPLDKKIINDYKIIVDTRDGKKTAEKGKVFLEKKSLIILNLKGR